MPLVTHYSSIRLINSQIFFLPAYQAFPNFYCTLRLILASRFSPFATGNSPLAILLYSFQSLITLHACQVIPNTLCTLYSLFVTRQSPHSLTRLIYSQLQFLPRSQAIPNFRRTRRILLALCHSQLVTRHSLLCFTSFIYSLPANQVIFNYCCTRNSLLVTHHSLLCSTRLCHQFHLILF